jgi:pyruvate/2-oxoglutarate dehydrogenase complex dihydrolipoamide acyltransferase (E2) component
MTELRSPLQAHIVQTLVQPGQAVHAGQLLLVLEAMKMEHEICAPTDGTVRELQCHEGDTVQEGAVLLVFDAQAAVAAPAETTQTPTPMADCAADPALRPDLARVLARHALTLDASRPEAMAKRHALGLRSARENIADLVDADSFSEYGALAVAAQSKRRSADDLARNTPADGMVCGTARVQAQPCVVMAYDATVLAGTQGMRNHQKTDRMLGIALANKLPVILFAEGGGGAGHQAAAAAAAVAQALRHWRHCGGGGAGHQGCWVYLLFRASPQTWANAFGEYF